LPPQRNNCKDRLRIVVSLYVKCQKRCRSITW